MGLGIHGMPIPTTLAHHAQAHGLGFVNDPDGVEIQQMAL